MNRPGLLGSGAGGSSRHWLASGDDGWLPSGDVGSDPSCSRVCRASCECMVQTSEQAGQCRVAESAGSSCRSIAVVTLQCCEVAQTMARQRHHQGGCITYVLRQDQHCQRVRQWEMRQAKHGIISGSFEA